MFTRSIGFTFTIWIDQQKIKKLKEKRLAKLSRYVRKIPSRRVRSRFKFRLKTLKPSPSLSTYNSQSMIVAIKSRDIAGPANQTKYKIRNRMVRKQNIYTHI